MKKVLVFEDSPIDARFAQGVLSHAGWLVSLAPDASDVVSRVKLEQPDAILMDVNMPGPDGFTAARRLVSDPDTRHIPIVFVTGKNQLADRVFAQMIGAKGLVAKPYQPAELLSAMPA